MKIRNGFVSNSSSSSFIVGFERKPKNKRELQDLIFGPSVKLFANPFQYGDEPEAWPVEEVVDIVWKDLKGQKPMTAKRIAECAGSYLEPYADSKWPYKDVEMPKTGYELDWEKRKKLPEWKEYEKRWDKMKELVNDWEQKAAKKLLKDYDYYEFYEFEYTDNGAGPLGAAMEHGNLFQRMFHIKVSNH